MSAPENPKLKISSEMAAVRDHRRDFPAFRFVYPVISRRAKGLSLGINLNPDKRCNFNCVYCEVDRSRPGLQIQPTPESVREELDRLVGAIREGALGRDPRFAGLDAAELTIRDFAFSGDGEPTLVPDFDRFVEAVAGTRRDCGEEQAKIVLITNAAGLDKAAVRRGLRILDANGGEVWAKLDAGTEEHYRLVNRSFVRFQRILDNIRRTALERPIVIQTLFLKIRGEPMPPAEFDAYCRRLEEITAAGGRIKEIQAYTIARPAPEPWAARLSAEELEAFAEALRRRLGAAVGVYP